MSSVTYNLYNVHGRFSVYREARKNETWLAKFREREDAEAFIKFKKESLQPSQGLEAKTLEIYKKQSRLKAIQFVHAQTNLGLTGSERYVDQIMSGV